MSRLKELLGTKKLVAVVAVIASVLAFSTFTILENSRKEEEKAQLARQQQKLEAIQIGHQTKACWAFGNSLNLLTSNKVSTKKIKENNTLLNDYLEAWSTDDGKSNTLLTKLSKYQGVIADSLPEGDPKESKELLAFQKFNFNALISSCELENTFTYPSTLTFQSGCSYFDDKNLRVDLQKKNSSDYWEKIETKDVARTDYCYSDDTSDGNTNGFWNGADFSINLGLMRNNLPSYGEYRVRWYFTDSQKFYYGNREIYSCVYKATSPFDTIYPVFFDSDGRFGCDGNSKAPEPEEEEGTEEVDPWSREFSNEWLEGTAKFTWCWNRGLEYSSEADACY